MASRRMFSIKMIDSAKFLKMPSSTRLLYYDLGMRADDDGVVEAFNVLKMTGATEDDLRILVAKDYIKVLNEDLVSYVLDWKEHNKIRADRKVDSLYKDLLLKILPEAKLLESKPRADRKNNGTSQGQPMDGIGQDRLGQDRLGYDREGYSSSREDIEEDIKEIMLLCQCLSYKLKKIDVVNFIENFGFNKVKKAISIATSTNTFKNGQVKDYRAYLASTLQDLSRDKNVEININKNKFTSHMHRDIDESYYDDLLGFD